MKIMRTSAILLLSGFLACESRKQEVDSVKIAEKENETTLGHNDKEADAEFIVEAVAASYSAISLVKLTMVNSKDTTLQRKVKVIAADHTRIISELSAYANSHLITVPAEESKDAKEKLKPLMDIRGEEFDAKVCSLLKDQFQDEIRKLEVCMSRTKDVELKNWIAITLPLLNDHLKMIKEQRPV